MAIASRPQAPAWKPFDEEGRSYLRVALPDADQSRPGFAIAQPLAGRYRIDELRSAGEEAALILAWDQRTSRPVAIKALRSDAAPPPGVEGPEGWAGWVRRQRHGLQTERRLLVRLRNAGCRAVPHPIDYAYDRCPAREGVGLDESQVDAEPYLVLELIPGRSLEEWIATGFPGGMPEAEALRLILPIVRTLEVLHEPWRPRGGRMWHCVYQDLKPANILVDPQGQPRLLDFGGCQVVIDGVPVLEGSRTPGYAPPECEGPARVLLPCADVYGIGCTLHHMLSGIDPRDRLARHRGRPGEHLDPRALPPGISAELRQLLARCLAPRPSDRIADARQVATALAPLLARTRDLTDPP